MRSCRSELGWYDLPVAITLLLAESRVDLDYVLLDEQVRVEERSWLHADTNAVH